MSSILRLFRGNKDVVAEAVQALAPYNVPPATREALARYLEKAADRELYRFNPAYLADQLGQTRRQGLELLWAALQSGLVTLNWEVQCPGCGYEGPAFASLRTAHSETTCAMCQGIFHAHLDDEIHITFSVNERFHSPTSQSDDPAWRDEVNGRFRPVNSHELLTLQIYRDMFVNEPLPDGESFQVKWMALMFTDLGGSTAIYARKGDPRAYSLVREHFRLIFAAVNEAGGAVVKTIGDAVMAVFPGGREALAAALGSQESIERFNRERGLEDDERLRLKVGLHAGTTLAVTLNDRLDYFGTVVNAAARVQGQAAHGEVVLTRQVLEDSGVRDLAPATSEPEMLVLRGLDDQPFEVVRIRQ
jgi:class 3 adenylate cyclase